MLKKVILLLGIFLLLLGCVQNQDSNSSAVNSGNNIPPVVLTDNNKNTGAGLMKVEKGNKVKVEYIGKLTDGTVFDKSEGRGPLEFTVGAGQMIKGFDEAVLGMKLNGEKTVTLPPEKAYGKEGSGQKMEVPINQIQIDKNLAVGMVLSSANGGQFKVIALDSNNATLQAIHQLEGKTLVFWIKVVSIDK